MKTMEKPRMNAREFNTTRARTRAAAWSLRISSSDTPETNERYDGMSGKTQGDRNEKIPAAKATKKLTSGILFFEQFLEQFPGGWTIPFSGAPASGEAFPFGADQISRGQPPGAVQLRDFRFRVQSNRISQLKLFDKSDRLLLAVFDVDGQHDKIIVLELLIKFFHCRHFLPARDAPSGPKIEEYGLSSEILEGNFLSFRRRETEFRGRRDVFHRLKHRDRLEIDLRLGPTGSHCEREGP